MTLPNLFRSLLPLLLAVLVFLGAVPVARASMPLGVAATSPATAGARSELEDRYRAFKQQWERNNLTIREQIEASALEARQAFANVTRDSGDNLEQVLLSLGDWATGVRREAGDSSDTLALRLQENLELGQRSVRDLARQFDAFQREVNRSTRTLPKELRDRFQGDALAVENSIDKATQALLALVSDAKDTMEDASGELKAKIEQDLQNLEQELENANNMVTSFFQVA